MKTHILKPKTVQLLLTITILFLTACGCTKNNPLDELPPATQTGANTFGCIYDGVAFTPKRGRTPVFSIGGTREPLKVYRHYTDTEHYSFQIEANRGKDVKNLWYMYIYIYRLPLKGVGEYNLKDAIYNQNHELYPYHSYILCRAQSPTTGEWIFYGSFENSGKIIITRKDEDNFIFSGTFSGKLKEENGTEIFEITDGRFDINKKTLNESR